MFLLIFIVYLVRCLLLILRPFCFPSLTGFSSLSARPPLSLPSSSSSSSVSVSFPLFYCSYFLASICRSFGSFCSFYPFSSSPASFFIFSVSFCFAFVDFLFCSSSSAFGSSSCLFYSLGSFSSPLGSSSSGLRLPLAFVCASFFLFLRVFLRSLFGLFFRSFR